MITRADAEWGALPLALLLGALAVSPQAIATYFELRAKRHGFDSAQ
ncbi:MAG: hypothetical protein JOY92_12665 [Verrucomicrobia bacterium]|nr:hypothetical protein [Verrucomicrobiota bacterium]